jgi:2-keto-4-pentenoate hydratase/2-oxohepta-3-ene-1,7-dioic acid hydratase in catechol pathway
MTGYSVPTIAGGTAIINNIYCIGRNYAEHAAELNNPLPAEPVVFLKTLASLRLPGESGRIAFPDETFHHEAEMVLLVGQRIERPEDCRWERISHVGLGLDLTRREVQNSLKEKGLPWARAKSFRGSAVVAPLIPATEFRDKSSIQFTFSVNGDLKQDGDTAMMLFKVEQLLAALLQLHPLAPGDLIFTGTPKGVGPLRAGDRFQLAFKATKHAFDGVL